MRRRQASYIPIVLSKAALSGPSVCLRARAPCPLRVSYLRPDHARACSVAAGCGVLVPRGLDRLLARRSAHARTRTALLSRSTQAVALRTVQISASAPKALWWFTSTSLRTVQTHLCVCTKYCGVSRRVRPVSFVDGVVLSLTLPYFPGSFLSRTPRVKHVERRQDNRP